MRGLWLVRVGSGEQSEHNAEAIFNALLVATAEDVFAKRVGCIVCLCCGNRLEKIQSDFWGK